MPRIPGHFLFTSCKRYICKVGIERLAIKDFLLKARNHLVLDVRSPGEYQHAHFPGAISFPLFSDEERKIVGTTYKQQSREQAIKIGLDIFAPKMRKMIEEIEAKVVDISKNGNESRPSTLLVYCWRGGMRSAAIAWLLDLYGFKIHTLAGGYKAYRNEVLQTFEQPFHFKVLGGYTGSGKTEVLKQMQANHALVIDLEGLASHKGSAFGSLHMPPQPTQEMFENLLAQELWKKYPSQESPIWVEDESQRIGNLNLPGSIWNNMRTSPVVFLQIPFEQRLDYIVREYGVCDTDQLSSAVVRISKRLGGLETKNALEKLQQQDKKEAFRILLHYYDKLYVKGLHNREHLPALITYVDCDTVNAANSNHIIKYEPA